MKLPSEQCKHPLIIKGKCVVCKTQVHPSKRSDRNGSAMRYQGT
jgi:hypothetical protein